MLISTIKPNYGDQIFDVTEYGAIADGTTDNSAAFLNAWNAACKIGGSATFLIPRGAFFLGPVSFRGPCTGNQSPRVEIRGTVSAPEDLRRIRAVGWIEFRSLVGLVVGGGGILDGKGAESWDTCHFCRNRPITLRLIKLRHSRVENLTLLNSKGFHMAIHLSNYTDVSHLKILAPGSSPNTDGCHVSGSTFVNITNILVGTGDDCISIGAGSSNISISGVYCSPGHGISIGSLGKYPKEKDVVGVRVRNCTISRALNGVRIKTWAGSRPSAAKDIVFEDIIMKNVSHPIVIDQEYCPSHGCADKPSLVQISDVLFKNIQGTTTKLQGAIFFCSKRVPCKNVRLENISLDYIRDGIRSGAASLCSNMLDTVFGDMKTNPCQ